MRPVSPEDMQQLRKAQAYPFSKPVTAYLTDAGMCGDYDSVIGMKKGPLVQRAATRLPVERKAPAEGPATMCGVYIESDDVTGLATRVEMIRVGGRLKQTIPVVDR